MSAFDWVTARNNCTAASEFKNLRKEVIADMKTRTDQDGSLKHQLEFREIDENRFSVLKSGFHEIVFERDGEKITARNVHPSGSERHIITVAVGMNEQGECTLQTGGKELLSWQVRRKALEETLFG